MTLYFVAKTPASGFIGQRTYDEIVRMAATKELPNTCVIAQSSGTGLSYNQFMRSRAPKWLPLSEFLKQHNEYLPPPPEPKAKVDSKDENLSPEALHGRVLGLHGQVNMSDIKRHYRERMMEYHPDRVAALGPKLREVAEHETKQIIAAYEFFTKKYATDKSA